LIKENLLHKKVLSRSAGIACTDRTAKLMQF
jgi:hypothetical protein